MDKLKLFLNEDKNTHRPTPLPKLTNDVLSPNLEDKIGSMPYNIEVLIGYNFRPQKNQTTQKSELGIMRSIY